MASQSTNASSGIFFPLLAVLFIGLKLTNHIAWSWWWVLSPLWVPFVIVVVVFLVILLIAAFKSPPEPRW